MPQPAVEGIVVLITTPSREEAERLGDFLIESKLAACVNIIEGVLSLFVWEGKRSRESETLMLAKTKRGLFQPLCDAVRARHSYSVPEIIALPIVEGSAPYLQWVEKNTQSVAR
jgi:periplasmic divalent cation tolerance protein